MVRFNSDRRFCGPPGLRSKMAIDASNDDSNRNQRLAVPEGARAVLMQTLQALIDRYNIPACEIIYRLDSGKMFRITTAHPDIQEVQIESFLERQVSRASVDAVEGRDQEVTASEGKQARGLPCASCHIQKPKRKTRGSKSPTPISRKKQKARRGNHAAGNSGNDSESEDEPDELEGAETEMRQIRICDVGHDYYEVAFRSINQLCCKDINKAWIRICHPRKQTSHPYNGGKTNTERSLKDHDYKGHYTMPDYWPSDDGWKESWGCRHKEPDHVKKPERLILLVHLLRSQGKGYKDGNFSIDKLKKATAGIHLECGKHWKPEYVERLEEIYWVREKEMEFERGQIDEDTLVSVRMPKPRGKSRKSSKSARVERPSSEQIKREPEERNRNSTTCNAPTASMNISLQLEGDDLDPSEVSEPVILTDRSSSTEEVAPDASYPEPTLYRARTNQHGLPFSDSLSPTITNSRHSSVKENWSPQSVDFGQDPTVFTHPSPFGSVATPDEVQKAMPLYDQCHYGSSSMHTFHSQGFVRNQFDHGSTTQRVANQMGPTQTSTRLPVRPVARKAENPCHQRFSASSADVAGWHPNVLRNAQIESSMYDADVSILPSTNGSCGSGYSNASYSTGLQVDDWNDGNQGLLAPYNHGLVDQPLSMHTVNNSVYQTDTASGGNLSNQLMYSADCRTNTPMGTEREFDWFSQDQRRF